MVVDDSADDHRLLSARGEAQGVECRPSRAGRHDRHQPTLVGDLQWVEPHQGAGAAHGVGHRHGELVDLDAHTGRSGDLVECGGEPAASGVAQGVDVDAGIEQGGHESVDGCRIADHWRTELEPFAHTHHRHPVLADGAGQQHGIASGGALGPHIGARPHDPHPSGGDVDAVAATPLDDLGVAGHDGHTRSPRGGTHGVGDARQHVDRCAFLDHEGRREVKRNRTGAGQIVDRAVNSERPDVAAREEQRRHDEGIGAQGEPATDRSGHDRGIC